MWIKNTPVLEVLLGFFFFTNFPCRMTLSNNMLLDQYTPDTVGEIEVPPSFKNEDFGSF